jgi:hypothetical protein
MNLMKKNLGFSWTAPVFSWVYHGSSERENGWDSSSTNSGNWDIYATNQQTAKARKWMRNLPCKGTVSL